MKQEKIRQLIDVLAASSLMSLEYSEDGASLKITKLGGSFDATATPDVAPSNREQVQAGWPLSSGSTSLVQPPAPALQRAVISPLFGLVHLTPAPQQPPFVKVGDRVSAGQTICIVEAMKVFNEVRVEHAGVVSDILVHSGDEVEAGQALFQLEQG